MSRVAVLLALCLGLCSVARSEVARPQACGGVLSLAALEARVADDPAAAELVNFYTSAVLPVLLEAERLPLANVHFDVLNRTIWVESPDGTYAIELTDDPARAYPQFGIPKLNLTRNGVWCRLIFCVERALADLPRTIGRVRSALRADRYLHPHLLPPIPGYRKSISMLLGEAMDGLLQLEHLPHGMRGLNLPMSNGKTFFSASYADQLGSLLASRNEPGWGKPPRVLYIVQHKFSLRQAKSEFLEVLGETKTVAELFGPGSTKRGWTEPDIVLASRTAAHRQQGALLDLLTSDREQPWIIVLDEAQHLGTNDGEFEEFLGNLQKRMDGRHRVLAMSAFLRHADKALVKGLLRGAVVAPTLTTKELAKFRAGKDLAALTTLQYFRTMERGYSSPLEEIHFIRTLRDGSDPIELLRRGQADAANRTRTIKVPHNLLAEVADRIRERRVPGLADRGVIFVASRQQADAYAKVLKDLLKEDVRPFHSGEDVHEDIYDWISDEGVYAEERGKHKYVFVVDMFREAINVRNLNLQVNLRVYADSLSGFGLAHQANGRLGRNFAAPPMWKPGVRAFDFVGALRWYRNGLARILVEQPTRPTNFRMTSPYVYLEEDVYDAFRFAEDIWKLFPENYSFSDRFWFFDAKKFLTEGVPVLRRFAANVGIRNWNDRYATRDLVLLLAGTLPEGEAKDALLTRLKDEAHFPWRKHAGVLLQEDSLALQMLFQALAEIAEVLEPIPHPLSIDIQQLHGAKMLQRLCKRLKPADVPLPDALTVKQFLDWKTGAMPLVVERMMQVDSAYLGGYAMRDFFHVAAKKLTFTSTGQALYEGTDERNLWDWAVADGTRDLQYPRNDLLENIMEGPTAMRWGLHRSYRALRHLAFAINEAQWGKIDPAKVHLRSEVEKIFAILLPMFPSKAKEDREWATLGQSDSIFGALHDRYQLLRVSPLRTSGALYAAAKKLAALLPEGDPAKRLQDAIADGQIFEWKKTDGVMVERSQEIASRRFHRFLYALAAAAVHSGMPTDRFDPKKVTSDPGVAGMLFDWLLFRVVVPPVRKGHRDQLMAEPGGAFTVFRDTQLLYTPERYPGRDFRLDHGLRNIVKLYASKIPKTPRVKAVMRLVLSDAFGWAKSEGIQALAQHGPTLDRFLRAMRIVAALWNEQSDEKIDLVKISSQYTGRAFAFALWKFPVPPRLREDEMSAFLGNLWPEIKGMASDFGVTTFTAPEGGAKLLASRALAALPRGPLTAQVRKIVLHKRWDWNPADGASPTNGILSAADRHYRAYWLMAWILSGMDEEIRPSSLLTRAGAQRLRAALTKRL